MNAHLQLVVNQSVPQTKGRSHDAGDLRRLAIRMAAHIQSGFLGFARAVAEGETLSPIEAGAVATWLCRAGVSENQILFVLAPPGSRPDRAKRPRTTRKVTASSA